MRVPLILLSGLVVVGAPARGAEGVGSSLSYALEIDLEGRKVDVTGSVTGHPRDQLTKFGSYGLRRQVKIAVHTDGGAVKFRYRVPIDQDAFSDPFQPVLTADYFAGFVGAMLLAPRVEGAEFTDIDLEVGLPEGWGIATSRGVGKSRITLAHLDDLGGTLICAGDYTTHSFQLENQDRPEPTEFHIALRGHRDWDDAEFFAEFRRLARGQMDYFGGSHPAPIQFLALHLLPEGENPSIPGFNRRVPGHDTVMALHTPARPRGHFEFLGMLAHEHLHNWYPNAMKSDLGPWFMEGLNDYVAYRGLLANGLHTREQFSGMLSKWHREYEMCVRTGNQRVMPYRRGMIAAWVFDIELRRATGGEHGLTDVLLRLIGSEPEGGIVQRRHLLAMLREVSGEDMGELYRHLVEDEGAIDLARFLRGTGFRIVEGSRAIEIAPGTEAERELFAAILSE